MEKLLKALKKKGAFIYYHDNGSWIVYSRKPKNLNDEPKILCEGDEWDCDGRGYAPSIVVALAKLLDIEVDSV